jgi:2-polyprenyl-6-methoxyphenol hydroxylase-like FAD-dependent oxidoreductase
METSTETNKCFAAGKKIIVAGGGMAGLCFVIALRKQWQSRNPSLAPPLITIYERDASKTAGRGREGYSLSIRSDGESGGMQTLQKLGLLDLMITRTGGSQEDHAGTFCLWDKDWNEVFRAQQKLKPGLPQPHIRTSRSTLRQTLLEAVPEDVEIKWGTLCTSAEKTSDGRVKVQLSNGQIDECDLLVAADGSRSKVRAAIRPKDTLDYQGVVSILGTAKFTDAVPRPADKDWGMNMTGTGIGLFVGPVDKQSAVWSMSYLDPELKETPKQPLTTQEYRALMNFVLEHGSTIPEPFRTYIEATDQSSLSVLNAMDKEPFSHDSEELKDLPVVFIGDANHAVSPFAGNGANMALMDGWVLAEQLCKHQTLREAVSAYDAESLPRSKSVLKMSHRTIAMTHWTGWRLFLLTFVFKILNRFFKFN